MANIIMEPKNNEKRKKERKNDITDFFLVSCSFGSQKSKLKDKWLKKKKKFFFSTPQNWGWGNLHWKCFVIKMARMILSLALKVEHRKT